LAGCRLPDVGRRDAKPGRRRRQQAGGTQDSGETALSTCSRMTS
jgi:hypothetical protein